MEAIPEDRVYLVGPDNRTWIALPGGHVAGNTANIKRLAEGEELDYALDFDLVLDEGELITSVTWSTAPPLTLSNGSIVEGRAAKIFISGALAGGTYDIDCEVETNVPNRTYIRRLVIKGVEWRR